jgi:hypothetical protein
MLGTAFSGLELKTYFIGGKETNCVNTEESEVVNQMFMAREPTNNSFEYHVNSLSWYKTGGKS